MKYTKAMLGNHMNVGQCVRVLDNSLLQPL